MAGQCRGCAVGRERYRLKILGTGGNFVHAKQRRCACAAIRSDFLAGTNIFHAQMFASRYRIHARSFAEARTERIPNSLGRLTIRTGVHVEIEIGAFQTMRRLITILCGVCRSRIHFRAKHDRLPNSIFAAFRLIDAIIVEFARAQLPGHGARSSGDLRPIASPTTVWRNFGIVLNA